MYQAFEVDAGYDSTLPGSVYVGSSGEATPYSVEVLGYGFVDPAATVGMTNEEFLFDVVTAATMDSGLYVDTLVFTVDDVGNSPRIAVVYLALGCCTGQATGTVYPSALAFGAPPNTPHTQTGGVFVTSTNAPAPFTVEVWGSEFTQLIETSGVTDDSLIFEVTTGDGLEIGVYIDTLAFYIEGTAASPNLVLLLLEVKEDMGPDTAIVHTYYQHYMAPEGENLTQTGYVVVTATGLPKDYTIGNLDEPEFLHLLGSGGMTGVATHFEVISTDDMAPGIYVDTIMSTVDDTYNSPILTPIYLYIDSVVNVTGDSALVSVQPGSFFDAPSGEDYTQSGSLIIEATGDPRPFTITHLVPGGFVQLSATSGTTNDVVGFDVVSTASMAPGVYVDSLLIEVDSTVNSPVVRTIYLNIESDPPYIGFEVYPLSLPFEAEYGLADTLGAYIHVTSSNEPANFTAFGIGGPSTFIHIPDSLGVTPDSMLIQVVPEGFEPGVHTDTVVVEVDGFWGYAAVVVTLEITQQGNEFSQTSLELSNYPNPFNPRTEIIYSLPSDAEVTLTVYNILGREVIRLVEGVKTAGEHRIEWDGRDDTGREVASGIYLYRLQADAASTTKKMILLK
jgi:hypothetical protein